MLPEQITKPRENMTARADIHGLGAILYHMLTGRPPYQGVTVLETIELVQRQEPIPLCRSNPKIPADLETICLKCLEKDPDWRDSWPKLVADDVCRWQEGRPISARPVLPLAKSWRGAGVVRSSRHWRRPCRWTMSISFVVVTLLWRQAEANFQMSNDVLADLVDLSVGGQQHLPRVMTLDRQIPLLEKFRQRFLELATSRPHDLTIARQLELVERRLGQASACPAAWGRSNDVAGFSGEDGSAARRNPADETVRDILSHRLYLLAEVSEGMDRIEDSVMYLRQSIQLAMRAFVSSRANLGSRFSLKAVGRSDGCFIAWAIASKPGCCLLTTPACSRVYQRTGQDSTPPSSVCSPTWTPSSSSRTALPHRLSEIPARDG